ncbi:MAG: phosphatase PAP2 family protein [Gemmatimonadota bacterium]
MPLVNFIGRHAPALLFGLLIFALLLGSAIMFLARFAWLRRDTIWNGVSHVITWIQKRPPLRWLEHRFPRLSGTFTRKRLTTTGFLELYLVTGLVLSAALLLFLALAEDVLEVSRLVAFDHELATALQNTVTQQQLAFLRSMTLLGSGMVLSGIGVAVAVALLLFHKRIVAIGWLVTLMGSGVLNMVLKASFHRVRPEYSTIGGWSFPSGHAMGSLVTYGMLAYLAARFLPRRPAQMVAIMLLLLVLLIGISRIYLGVHYFSDVVAGYSAAIVWLAVCISAIQVAEHREKKKATTS